MISQQACFGYQRPIPDQTAGFFGSDDFGELGGKVVLEESRDFAAQIQAANLKQFIKAASNRSRLA